MRLVPKEKTTALLKRNQRSKLGRNNFREAVLSKNKLKLAALKFEEFYNAETEVSHGVATSSFHCQEMPEE